MNCIISVLAGRGLQYQTKRFFPINNDNNVLGDLKSGGYAGVELNVTTQGNHKGLPLHIIAIFFEWT